MDSDRLHKGKAPKLRRDDLRPVCHRMEKHSPSMRGDNANVAFNDAVLPMGTDTGEGMRLSTSFNVCDEFSRSKHTVVGMNVLDRDSK